LLREFKETIKANGSEFLLVTLTNPEQIHPEMQQELRKRYRVDFDFQQPDRIIGEFAINEQMTHLQLLSSFRDYYLQTGNIFMGWRFQEWTLERGWSRSAAEKIFQFLRDGIFLLRTVDCPALVRLPVVSLDDEKRK
jgi:hypothetical protein